MFEPRKDPMTVNDYKRETQIAQLLARLIPMQAQVEQLKNESRDLARQHRQYQKSISETCHQFQQKIEGDQSQFIQQVRETSLQFGERLDKHEQQLAAIAAVVEAMQPLFQDMLKQKEDRAGLAKTLVDAIVGGIGDKLAVGLVVLVMVWFMQAGGIILKDNGVDLPSLNTDESPDE